MEVANSPLPTARVIAEGSQESPSNTVSEGTLCQLAPDLVKLGPEDNHEAFL